MIAIDIVNKDLETCDVDIVSLAYDQEVHGLTRRVTKALESNNPGVMPKLPALDDHTIFDSPPNMMAKKIMFIGIVPFQNIGYDELRKFTKKSIELASGTTSTLLISSNVSRKQYGLDDAISFKYELFGIVDALRGDKKPAALRAIHFLEKNVDRYLTKKHVLDAFLPFGGLDSDSGTGDVSLMSSTTRKSYLATLNKNSPEKHVFVAMPFSDEMFDVFHYGIKNAVKAASMACERIDRVAFTGSILRRIMDRIDKAHVVIADLSGQNANVSFEAGYALGRSKPVIVLIKKGSKPPSNLTNEKYLEYTSIFDLEKKLREEIVALDNGNDNM